MPINGPQDPFIIVPSTVLNCTVSGVNFVTLSEKPSSNGLLTSVEPHNFGQKKGGHASHQLGCLRWHRSAGDVGPDRTKTSRSSIRSDGRTTGDGRWMKRRQENVVVEDSFRRGDEHQVDPWMATHQKMQVRHLPIVTTHGSWTRHLLKPSNFFQRKQKKNGSSYHFLLLGMRKTQDPACFSFPPMPIGFGIQFGTIWWTQIESMKSHIFLFLAPTVVQHTRNHNHRVVITTKNLKKKSTAFRSKCQ